MLASAQLAGKPCRVFTSDLREHCLWRLGARPRGQQHLDESVGIVEVLSPSTQRYDREEKAAHYRRSPSLASYALISQEEQGLEVFSRNSDGSWTLREARSGAVELMSIGCSLAVADVYRNPLQG